MHDAERIKWVGAGVHLEDEAPAAEQIAALKAAEHGEGEENRTIFTRSELASQKVGGGPDEVNQILRAVSHCRTL